MKKIVSAPSSAAARPLTIAIVGRPNVGKSTLFNRIAGRRRAIVGDEPGITRDRLFAPAEWNGRRLRVIDTGGMLPDQKDLMAAAILRQARLAIAEADALVLVVDGRSPITAPDLDLARLLRRSGKPLYLAVNKIDSPQHEPEAEEFHRLGIRHLFPLSAEHGAGVAEMLDALVGEAPTTVKQAESAASEGAAPAQEAAPVRPPEINLAIIGRPNVGKSTLLNQLTQSERAIVSSAPGTTRDAVDEVIERNQRCWRLVDTAGIRRKGKTRLMAEKLAVIMARKHLETADIALLMLDASEGVTASDATIAGYAHESGRSIILVVNKWDLAGERADRALFEQQARRMLKFLAYAPMVFISASRGTGIPKLFATAERVAHERRKRISTAEMNRFLQHLDSGRAPVPSARQVRIYYMTQALVSPPTFILFTDRRANLHFSYQRFLENQIRRVFGFEGAPLRIKVRPKPSRR